VCPTGVADRVNLGLIPSSEVGWEAALRALRPETGGVLHVHGNVDIDEESSHPSYRQWVSEVIGKVKVLRDGLCSRVRFTYFEPLSVNKVKSYAPKVDHVVLDVRVKP
jgi:tRNA G37 N-methylase Trm5